jgi:hypothetical protein
MEPKGSLSRSQEPTTVPYYEQDVFAPHLLTLGPVLILFSHLRLRHSNHVSYKTRKIS